MADLCLHRPSLHRVCDGIEVDGAFVRHVEKHVVRVLGAGPALLAAKDEVDPVVEVLAHVLALQCLSLQSDELVGGAVGPRGQHHIVQGDAILKKRGGCVAANTAMTHLSNAKMKAVGV